MRRPRCDPYTEFFGLPVSDTKEPQHGTVARPHGTGSDSEGICPVDTAELSALLPEVRGHYRRSPEDLGEAEIRTFLLHTIQVEQVSYPTYRQILAALKSLYKVTLGREWEVRCLPFPKYRQPALPRVMRDDQLLALFAALKRPKYRALFMTCYAAGLRISEACRLRIEDIDSRRMVIRVPQGNGSKERYTVLSPRLLTVLRLYWKLARPLEWMFPGQGASGTIAPDTVRQVFRRAREEAGLGPWCTPHVLRNVYSYYCSSLRVDYLKGNSACFGWCLCSWRPLRTAWMAI